MYFLIIFSSYPWRVINAQLCSRTHRSDSTSKARIHMTQMLKRGRGRHSHGSGSSLKSKLTLRDVPNVFSILSMKSLSNSLSNFFQSRFVFKVQISIAFSVGTLTDRLLRVAVDCDRRRQAERGAGWEGLRSIVVSRQYCGL